MKIEYEAESECYNLISVCSTPNFGAILVFKKEK